MAVTDSGNFSENKGYSLDVFNNAKQTAYNKGYQAGVTAMKAKAIEIIQNEIVIAHTTTSGKTSRLTSALNRLFALPITDKEHE